ncbi:unnamed protein product [Gongylonema pulchrum]|uniref:ZP domain-containing protein n=1 Tax=Gongylonema pulchrum TaxID=637853 RepID=A0A183DDY1_9BILA|nr:unnamed protein product [Gongylonema pulchrum]
MLPLLDYIASITIDNDIIGDPDIECLDEQIRVFVKTRKIFNGCGRIYAKGKAEDPACSKDDFALQKTRKPHMVLKFGTCGMKSLRSVDPRGMYYGITVVVSFHTVRVHALFVSLIVSEIFPFKSLIIFILGCLKWL